MPERAGTSEPQVSVIIGTFDCESFVEQCVRSVMNQTERNIEIIVVDDGSADGTLRIVEELAAQDPRIQVHQRGHTGFPGCTRNHGLVQAKGQYVAFLDGDDLYHPEKIQSVLAAFGTCPEADVVIHDLMHFDHWPVPEGASSYLAKSGFLQPARALLKEAGDRVYLCHGDLFKFMSLRFVPFCTDSIIIRRKVLLEEPEWFREDLRIGEDGDLWLRLARHRSLAYVHKPLSYYRVRPGSITGDQVLFLLRTIQIHEENLERCHDAFNEEELSLYRAKIAGLLFDLGYEYSRKRSFKEARKAYKQSLLLNFQVKPLLAYIKSFAPLAFERKLARSS